MADTKITALAAITTVDPAADVLPIVDVSDTSMAASGTTKKITSNQILGAGGTATLASATITGDLTVATNRLVVNASGICIGTTTATPFAGNVKTVVGAGTGAIGLTLYGGTASTSGYYFADGIVGNETYRGYVEYSHTTDSFAFGTAGTNRYTIDSTGIATWLVAGSTAMTLNSTGLGVGTATIPYKLTVASPGSSNTMALINNTSNVSRLMFAENATPSNAYSAIEGDGRSTGYIALRTNDTERLRVDSSGNVGVGVTPSAWTSSYRALQIGTVGAISSGSSSAYGFTLSSNLYQGASGNQYITTGYAGRYDIRTDNGNHVWYTSASGSGGGVILLSTAMTLDASGNLLVGKTASSTTVAGSQVQPDGTFSAVKGDANPGFFYNRSTAASGTIALFRSNSVTVGSITQDGTNTSYVTSSDYRLKDSIQPLSGGLARVNSLKPSIYTWKTNGSSGEGFLAHELAEVVPSAVVGTKDAVDADGNPIYQGVDLSKVVPILVAAIKELTARVEALEA